MSSEGGAGRSRPAGVPLQPGPGAARSAERRSAPPCRRPSTDWSHSCGTLRRTAVRGSGRTGGAGVVSEAPAGGVAARPVVCRRMPIRTELTSGPRGSEPRVRRLHISVVKGAATEESYSFTESVISIGRTAEPTDERGRVRRNDVAFLDEVDGITETVGRAHARLQMDRDRGVPDLQRRQQQRHLHHPRRHDDSDPAARSARRARVFRRRNPSRTCRDPPRVRHRLIGSPAARSSFGVMTTHPRCLLHGRHGVTEALA